MKILYGKKDKGVSPVIATILMVAITVVLAATVYLMVSGYMTGPSKPALYASLTEQQPIPSATEAILTLSMSSPASIPVTDLHVTIGGLGYAGVSVPFKESGTGSSGSPIVWSATAYYSGTAWSSTTPTSGSYNTITIQWTSLSGTTVTTTSGTVYSGDQFTVTLGSIGATPPVSALTGVTIQMSSTTATGTTNMVTLV